MRGIAFNKRATMSTTTQDHIAIKVPEVTLLFWVIKIAATTLGETTGDAADHQSDAAAKMAIVATTTSERITSCPSSCNWARWRMW